MTTRLIFAGTGPLALPVLEALVQSDLDLCLVVTRPDARSGRGRKQQEQDVSARATELGLTVYKPDKINSPNSLKTLQECGADLMLTASFGQFFGTKLLNMFPFGCWNLHPSNLPKYRGAAPINATLRDGLEQTAVCLFRMVKEMDAGPIAAKTLINIDTKDTAGTLLERCAVAGGKLAVNTIPQLKDGSATLQEQDDSTATFCSKLSKDSGHLDWTQSSHELINLARSVDPWPGVWTTLDDVKLNLGGLVNVESATGTPGTVVNVDKTTVVIACGNGAIAPTTWQLAGKKKLSTRDFLNGRHLAVGTHFGH